MKWFDYDHIQRIVVFAGLAVVLGLWAAEDAGLLPVASHNLPPASASLPQLPGAAPTMPHLTLQGVIAGSGSAPPVALLAEAGKRPVLVAEGSSFGEDIRVERVLPDRVVLRWRGSNAPIVVRLSPAGGSDGSATADVQTSAPGSLPQPPADAVAPRRDEALPADRVPAPSDASGLPPGPSLTGPALSGPAPGSTN